MMTTLQTKPYTLPRNKGQCLHSSGAWVTAKATSEQTGGLFNLFEIYCPSYYATPLHIHYAEDVVVYILDGALTYFWGNEKKEAAAGSYAYQPRGTPHGFRVEGLTPIRILYMTIPAGFDRFIIGSERLVSCSEAMMTAARYKIEILGPLPE